MLGIKPKSEHAPQTARFQKACFSEERTELSKTHTRSAKQDVMTKMKHTDTSLVGTGRNIAPNWTYPIVATVGGAPQRETSSLPFMVIVLS
jgi:hypothetical protein